MMIFCKLVLLKKFFVLGNCNGLINLVNSFIEKGIGLRSLNDHIDTTTAHGRLIFNIFGSLAEFERELIKERTIVGLDAARARGKKGGRPSGLSKEAQAKAHSAELIYKEGKLSVSEICDQLSLSRATFYKYLKFRQVPIWPGTKDRALNRHFEALF